MFPKDKQSLYQGLATEMNLALVQSRMTVRWPALTMDIPKGEVARRAGE